MRSIPIVAVAALLSSATAEADVSKAWQAAKDNLPASIPAIMAVDAAAVVKLPAFSTLFALARKEERDIQQAYDLFQSACKVDFTQAVDGFVIAGDPNGRDDDVVVFLQLTMDRAKASSCIEAAVKSVEKKKPVTIKQDGVYTVATVGKETAYFAWVAPNVVAFTMDPEKKQLIEANVGKKGLGKAPVGALLGKMDAKAIAFGAIKMSKPIDSDIPFTSGFGNVTLNGGTLSGSVSGTAVDAKTATAFADEAKRELAKMLKKDRIPAVVKKVAGAVKIAAAGTDVTVSGSASDKDLLESFLAVMMRGSEKSEEAMPPPATTKTPAKKM
jgi:hypothetical protein